MIQKKVIETLYKKYRKPPLTPDELDIPLLFEKLPESVNIEIDGQNLIIGAISPSSPFHRIPVRNINAIIEFDEVIAIVLHSSIIFISKEDGAVNVHLKEFNQSLLQKLFGVIPG